MITNEGKISQEAEHITVVPICCWCGKEKLTRGGTSVRHRITDYEPCPDCSAAFGEGVTFAEVTSEKYRIHPKLAPISYNADGEPTYPTFNAAVVKTEIARQIIPSADFKTGDRCCLYVEDFIRILGIEGTRVFAATISSECHGECLDDILNIPENS